MTPSSVRVDMVIMYGSLLLLLSAPSAAAAPAHVRREGRRHDEVKTNVSVSPGIDVGRTERVRATLAYRRRSWGDGRVRVRLVPPRRV